MRWILRLIGILVILVVLGFVGLLFLPTERIADLAAERFERATGRELVVRGELAPSFYPVLGVRTGPVEIANADWSDSGPMLSARGLEVGVNVMALFSGQIAIDKVELRAPRVVLERAADGRPNWELGAAAGEAGTAATGTGGIPAGLRATGLAQARIRDGAVTYIDHGAGTQVMLEGLDATLSVPDLAAAASLEGTATINGRPVALEASVERPAQLLEGGATPVTADVEAAGNRATFDGEAALSPVRVDGALRADIGAPAALLAALGLSAPGLPDGLAPLGLDGRISYVGDDGTLRLSEAAITVAGNDITGDAEFAPGPERPRLSAELNAGVVDLSPLLPAGASAGENAGGDAGGWPATPIDVGVLSAFDAEVALRADGVRTPGLELDATRADATLDAGRLVVALRELRAYDGTASGEIVVSGRGGLSVSTDLQLADLAMLPLLRGVADFERLDARASGQVSLLGAGSSVDAIMKSLSGDGQLRLGEGEIIGLDLVGMIRNMDLSYVGEGNRTIFNSIEGSFTVSEGVLRNDDLAFNAPLLTAEGAGDVDLGRRRVDYVVTPVALRGEDGSGGLRVPVRISGPWSGLNYGLDMEGAAEGLGVNREDLEQRARQAAEDAAGRLGVTREDGESAEDAARRTIEDEAQRRLDSLFGRGQ